MYSVSVCVYVCVYGNRVGEGGEIYDEELAGEIMEAESHRLPSASRRPWKASGIMKSEYKGLRTGFPGGSDGKVSACNVRDPGSIPGLGRSPGEGNGNPLQYSCLENSMD